MPDAISPAAATPGTLTALDVVTLARTLPRWSRGLDDDPNWLRPVHAAGLTRLRLEDDNEAHQACMAAKKTISKRGLPSPCEVPTAQIRYTGQEWLRIDALAHYLTPEEDRPVRKLFDPDGWYGNDHPVLFWYRDGYCVMDGNNRCAANRLAGAAVTTAHIIGARH